MVSRDKNPVPPFAQALACSAEGWALFLPELDGQGEVVDFKRCFSNAALRSFWGEPDAPGAGSCAENLASRLVAAEHLARYRSVFLKGIPETHVHEAGAGEQRLSLSETCLRIGGYLVVQVRENPRASTSPAQDPLRLRALEAELARSLARQAEVERRSEQLLAHIHAGVLVYSPQGRVVTFNMVACSLLGLSPGQLSGQEPMPPGWHFCRLDGSEMPVAEYPANLVLSRGEGLLEHVLGIRRAYDQSPVWCLVNAYPVFDGERLDAVVVSLIDISSQRRAAAVAESSRQRAEALLDLNIRAQQLDEDALLEEGVTLALRLTGSHAGQLCLVDSEGGLRLAACLVHRRTLGVSGDVLPLSDVGQWADCVRLHEPVVHNAFSPQLSPKGLPRRSSMLRRHLGVPVLENGRVVMMLGVANKPGAYDDSDVRLMQTLAHDLWKALQQQRLWAAWQADRRRLERIVAASHAGIWEFRLNEDGTAVVLAQAGIPENEQEESLDHFIARIHPEDQPAVLRAISACLVGQNDHYQQEFRLQVQPASDYRWILASGEVVERDGSGMPVSMAGTHLDTTEQRAVEEQLRLAATVFDSNGEGIIITGPDLRILSVNRVFSDVTGYSRDEAVGQKPSMLSSGQHDPAFYAAMWETLRQDGRWQGEVCNRRKDGSLYPEWLSISTVTDEQGQVTHYVGIFSDITERKRQQAHIEFLAFHDPLTSLPNRQLLSDRFAVARALADRQGQRMAILFLDLDRFKTVNDTLGHQAGDQVLTQTARRLAEIVRESDTVCRLGGDEFVVLLGGLRSADEAAEVAQSIIASIDLPFLAADQEARIAISVGIAIYPDDSHEFGELLKKADTALYQAKQEGRHAYRYFNDSLNVHSKVRQQQAIRLREGLEAGELEVFYQPLLSLADGRLLGVEALVRWRHPVDGLLLPEYFLPLAEESGQIFPLGAFVLEQACLQMRNWMDHGLPPFILSVNISACQLLRDNLIKLMVETLQRTGVPPYRLGMDVSEAVFLEADRAGVQDVLSVLHGLGVELAIDGFGSGYCSLVQLQECGVDRLKIDSRLVDAMEHAGGERLIRGIIQLARSLGIFTLAKGVERQGQLDCLLELGCDGVQGQKIAPPMPAAECSRWLNQYLRRSV